MTTRLPRIALVPAAALLCAVALAACGGGAKQPTAHGDSEGAYVQAGPLIYQVQLSRELNPFDVEDHEYLQGLSAGATETAPDELLFGIWLRVQNATDQVHPAASEFAILDTLGNRYDPIPLPASNPTAYTPRNVATDNGQPLSPNPESVAGSGPIQGSMLLFKLNTSVYSNRPLELEITPPDGGEPSTVDLDL
jgi:hypothetical protein